MNAQLVQDVADAVLYEGYLLYPYRPSALKNRRRFTFGIIAPKDECEAAGESWFTQTECLARAADDAQLNVRVRFLHISECSVVDGETPWQEGIPCDVHLTTTIGETLAAPLEHDFHLSARQPREPGRDAAGRAGSVPRRQEAVDGHVSLTLSRVQDWPIQDGPTQDRPTQDRPTRDGLIEIVLRVSNVTPLHCSLDGLDRDVLLRSLASTHAILQLECGQFVSMIDPPEDARAAASACRNVGTWPVLVGEEGSADAILSSPIILYDHPRIAPESPGALFDGTEIDEILTLRILTMTEAEKQEMRDGDVRGREILERTERLTPEGWQRLHGVMRDPRALEESS
jgi:hypothetical protein